MASVSMANLSTTSSRKVATPGKPSMIGKVRQFCSEVFVELGKATWPWDNKEKGVKKYRELIDSTIVVLIAMMLLGGYVAFWDLILSSVTGLISR